MNNATPYNLFLDDFRMPHDVGNYMNPVELRSLFRLQEWVIVRDYSQFVGVVNEKGMPSMISFDHDLAEEHYGMSGFYENLGDYYLQADREMTGYDCAKWLIEYSVNNKIKLPIIMCHSMNPEGRKYILDLFAKITPAPWKEPGE